MAKLEIICAPDPRLKRKSSAVSVVDDALRQLMDDMLDTMYAAPGVGLAAPQVGVLKRVIVVDAAREDEARQPYRMVNPEVLWTADEIALSEEGCLSLPDHFADVKRPVAARIAYLDETGAAREIEARGLLAVCVLHEIDHLEGVLFVDHISAIKRSMILRRLAKEKKLKAKEKAKDSVAA